MNRRNMLIGGSSVFVAGLVGLHGAMASSGKMANATRWKVRLSEGFDAIAFLGPLAGGELYREHYAADADAFGILLPITIRTQIRQLWDQANTDGFGLLGPNLQVLFSGSGNDTSLDTLLTALRAKEERILPSYRKSRYWSEPDWTWFVKAAPQLDTIFAAMQQADFRGFRAARTGGLEARAREVERALTGFDVISWQKKLTAREFDPTIEVVLLQFAKPHGIKVQGQTFLQSADYDTATTVRIAAHEMLHPPFDQTGAAAQAALTIFRQDPLITRIVREHDPNLGYTTLEGLLDEDLVQALDQLISEALGVARNPADRWHNSDDGIHMIAAGLYGLLREDRWVQQGGSIEKWLLQAAASGRLKRHSFHKAAAKVLDRPINRLWPLA
jgi:hypothetical protein